MVVVTLMDVPATALAGAVIVVMARLLTAVIGTDWVAVLLAVFGSDVAALAVATSATVCGSLPANVMCRVAREPGAGAGAVSDAAVQLTVVLEVGVAEKVQLP